jgi:hypothetical protein
MTGSNRLQEEPNEKDCGPLYRFCVLASAASFADALFLTPPTDYMLAGAAGSTRGDLVTMTSDFTLTSIGIQGQIDSGTQMTLSAYVYDSTGHRQLAIGNNVIFTGDGTEQFYNLPINFTLLGGLGYDIGIDFHSSNAPTGRLTITSSTPAMIPHSRSARSR